MADGRHVLKFGTVMQIRPLQRTDLLKFRIFKINDGIGHHLENRKNCDISAMV